MSPANLFLIGGEYEHCSSNDIHAGVHRLHLGRFSSNYQYHRANPTTVRSELEENAGVD